MNLKTYIIIEILLNNKGYKLEVYWCIHQKWENWLKSWSNSFKKTWTWFPRLSPEEKLEILKKNHPDYIESGFRTINLGVNKGQKVPLELANLIEAKVE